jgi:hypothetical protein
MALNEGIHVLGPSTRALSVIIESMVQIHASCVLNDDMVATFIPPLSHHVMTENWISFVNEVSSSSRLILIYVSKITSRSSGKDTKAPFEKHVWPLLPNEGGDRQPDLEVSGVVSLACPTSQTGPFRGLVQRLFISPYHRRKHLATHLVAELEKRAIARGRWSLMLDTPAGSVAEQMYLQFGYGKLGVVREYGISPKDGETLLDEVFFWKDLRKGNLTIDQH